MAGQGRGGNGVLIVDGVARAFLAGTFLISTSVASAFVASAIVERVTGVTVQGTYASDAAQSQYISRTRRVTGFWFWPVP